jgi:homoserine kinase
MALDLWNELEVRPAPSRRSAAPVVEVQGEGAGEVADNAGNLVYRSMAFLFNEAGREMPPLRLCCRNQIPLQRGLGSSAAAIAGGLVAANALCHGAFDGKALLEMAATIEGHPDNVAAAVLGGFQLVVSEGQRLYTAPIAIPADLHAVLFIPEFRMATTEARGVLPAAYSREDAVFNMSRAALLVAGLATSRLEYLGIGTQDRLHQPYRQKLFPAMKLLFQAARDAGALGVFLSGSGSTVLALSKGREMTVAYEMAEAARQAGVAGQVKITQPTDQGAHVVEKS